MYGLLSACGKPATALYSTSTTASSSTQHDQHNVLPLSVCQSRFQLLPLSSSSSGGGTGSGQTRLESTIPPPMIVQPHKTKVAQFASLLCSGYFDNI